MQSTLNHVLNILNAQYLLAVAIHDLSCSSSPGPPPSHYCYLLLLLFQKYIYFNIFYIFIHFLRARVGGR